MFPVLELSVRKARFNAWDNAMVNVPSEVGGFDAGLIGEPHPNMVSKGNIEKYREHQDHVRGFFFEFGAKSKVDTVPCIRGVDCDEQIPVVLASGPDVHDRLL